MPFESHHVLTSTYTLDKDITVFMLDAHMHMRGIEYRSTLLAPDGTQTLIYSKPLHHFRLSHSVKLNAPLFMAKGSKLLLEAIYDNSVDNPANPNPEATVHAGAQERTEEMSVFRLSYVEGRM